MPVRKTATALSLAGDRWPGALTPIARARPWPRPAGARELLEVRARAEELDHGAEETAHGVPEVARVGQGAMHELDAGFLGAELLDSNAATVVTALPEPIEVRKEGPWRDPRALREADDRAEHRVTGLLEHDAPELELGLGAQSERLASPVVRPRRLNRDPDAGDRLKEGFPVLRLERGGVLLEVARLAQRGHRPQENRAPRVTHGRTRGGEGEDGFGGALGRQGKKQLYASAGRNLRSVAAPREARGPVAHERRGLDVLEAPADLGHRDARQLGAVDCMR